jgi:hypothetical protein
LLALLAGLVAFGHCRASALFESDGVLEITLKGPLSAAIDDTEQRRELPFSLELAGTAIPVALRMRGKSRAIFCGFPPLRLDFAPESVEGTEFAGQDKLKLVTHCKGSGEFEQNVLEESAAYRILNVLTELSFRIRLLRVNYVDTDRPRSAAVTRYAFVIESDEEFARRIGGDSLGVRNVSRNMLDARHAALVYTFHYLIGNTDWSLVRYVDDEYCCHNGKLFSVDNSNYYIPYDFDMSGLVNASYAEPQPELRLRNVRTRRYRGYCTDRDVLTEALRTVVGHRDAILGVFSELPGLSAKTRQRQHRYLERFFAMAEKEGKMLDEFERRCL